MEMPLIAHRCGRAYGPDSSRQALWGALAGGTLHGVEADVCLTRDGALACLHDACLPLGTTLTGWAHERSAADVLAARLLDREGQTTVERPLLVDELLELVRPGLTVQLDIKAHADAALARRTVDALAAVLARRRDAGRVEVSSFHAAAVEQAVAHGLAGRLVIWVDSGVRDRGSGRPRRDHCDVAHNPSGSRDADARASRWDGAVSKRERGEGRKERRTMTPRRQDWAARARDELARACLSRALGGNRCSTRTERPASGRCDTADMTREPLSEAQSLRQLRAELAARLGRGDSLDSVERELIAHSPLSEEQKSALWLYGWSLPKLQRRRAVLSCLESLARA